VLWIDDDDAPRTIEAKLRSREITEEEAQHLAKFVSDGYFIIKIDLDGAPEAFDKTIEHLWKDKPADVAFAYDSPPLRFSVADESAQRKPRYRIHDLHSYFDEALRLYLHPTLVRYASLILGEQAIATQSLYFEFGSQQALHRDSIVVPTPQFGELLASWIALEDIDPRSGALAFVPGSHKIPFYDFGGGRYMFDGTDAGARGAMKYHDDECARRGLPVKLFEAKRGEVLIWHSALLHGGGPVADERLTRKSYVVHYSTASHHKSRELTVREGDHDIIWSTTKLLEREGVRGMDNPLYGVPL